MENNSLLLNEPFELDTNKIASSKNKVISYEIMHMEKLVARFSTNGKSQIINDRFMPYDLYLEADDENDIDVLINNISNFNHWCASRVLSLDRQYANWGGSFSK